MHSTGFCVPWMVSASWSRLGICQSVVCLRSPDQCPFALVRTAFDLAAAHRLEGAKNNVNKFPHLRKALGEFNQMLYDLAMQLFVLFPGAEDQFVANMAGILSICKECHDLPTLWAAFSHYYKKIAIPNFQVNESMIMETSKNPLCKSRFKELSAF